jgi:hypothetical protein
MGRNLTAAASLALYLTSLFLPGAKDEGPVRPGVDYLVFGGYFLVAAPLVPANLLFLLGWDSLRLGDRSATISRATLALLVGVVGSLPFGAIFFFAPYPAYWTWLASFAALAVAGGLTGPGQPDRERGGEVERRWLRAYGEGQESFP